MSKPGETAALIVAGGWGTRAPSDIPKQYQMIGEVAVLTRALRPFLDHPSVGTVRVVIGAGQDRLYGSAVPPHAKLRPPVTGGESRQASVANGLASLAASPPSRVLIHDAARPFVSSKLIDRVLGALAASEAVAPVLPVSSTLKRIAGARVAETVPRDDLAAAETPQGFSYAAIRAAHEKAAVDGASFTDDAAVAEFAGIPVAIVAGDPANLKLTTAEDIAAADRRIAGEETLRVGDVRVGIGYDVHALGSGHEVMLGGVAIPHSRGLIGHSDADVVLHAITDAILGALGEGDIGTHFPPSEPQWKDAPSAVFLADAVARVRARGGRIAHLDVALAAEGPKIAPHREAMRTSIAAICGIEIDRVGIKATTNEGLGYIGRSEGVAAQAVATIRLPYMR